MQMETSKLSTSMDLVTVSGDCETHGPWSDSVVGMVSQYARCPTCRAESLAQREREQKEQQSAQYAEQARVRRLSDLEDAGVCERYINHTFDTFIAENAEQQAALERCRALAEGVVKNPKRCPSIIMAGNPGTGKSHLACAMVIACHDGNRLPFKINVADMVRDFKDTWKKDSQRDERKLFDFYGNDVDLLILDEIGVQFGSDTEKMFLFEVINRRYERCLPTVLVSNLSAEKLRDEVGERVLDRLREDGGKLLKFTGDSWRKK